MYYIAYHEYVADTLDGGLADFLPSVDGKLIPRRSGNPKTSELLPPQWKAAPRPKTEIQEASQLYCHCKCGGVQFWISRPAQALAQDDSSQEFDDGETKCRGRLCCCTACRRDTGQAIAAWVSVPITNISLDAGSKLAFKLPFGTVQGFQSSSGVTRYFCRVCAASVFYVNSQRKGIVDVGTGLLKAVDGARAESWVEFDKEQSFSVY